MKQYIINTKDGVAEYDLFVDGERYILKHANGGEWAQHIRGTVALTIRDDGDGYRIEESDVEADKNGNINIDYSNAEQIYILLRAIKAINSRAFGEFVMIPAHDVIEL